MEDLNQITASIGSVIAGIYCIVKTIIAILKKQKKISQSDRKIL